MSVSQLATHNTNYMKPKAQNNAGPVIAVIEDADAAREFLTLAMKVSGFESNGYASAEAYYRDAVAHPADIVLIDLGLPGEDGLSAIRHLRQIKSLGIIVITGRGTPDDRAAGMMAGADYYFVKPVERVELVEAVNEIWQSRRAGMGGRDNETWRLDLVQSELITPNGNVVKLTASEALLLDFLAEHAGEVVGKGQLCTKLFSGDADISYHRVEVLVCRLRKKIRQHEIVFPLRSIFGKGISFTAAVEIVNRAN